MKKQVCPKCNTIISNDFGHTLAFCTNCGASISIGQTDKTLSLNETETMLSPAPQNLKSNGGGTGWQDKKYVEMVEKANLETDEIKRYKMLSDAETYLLEQQPVIPLGITSRGFLCQPYVKNLSQNSLGQINWREVYVEIN